MTEKVYIIAIIAIAAGGITINLNKLSEAGVIASITNAELANNSSFIFNVEYPA